MKKQNKLNIWISALRPRTLFLAAASAICGNAIAYNYGCFSAWVCISTIAIATILQLLSNLANDLGDYTHGTDVTGERVGPQRAVQSGAISPSEMKKAICITIAIAIVVGLTLIYEALQFMHWTYILLFIVLGAAAIIAALKYTAGKNPYGYKGWGDIFSFIFFGPVAIVGTFFLHAHQLVCMPWLPAIGIGLLTICVLNINNMRDLENDRKSGKITIAVRLGLRNAKRYHALLTIGALGCFVAYNSIYANNWYNHLYLITFVLFFNILAHIIKTKENAKLDPYLRATSMSAFLLAVCFCICINL